MAIKNSVSNNLRSKFVDSINVFDCSLSEVFIEYRPTEYITKNILKQWLLGIIYIFHVSVEKNNCVSTPDIWQSKTLLTIDRCGSEIIKLRQPVFSVANCHQSGD